MFQWMRHLVGSSFPGLMGTDAHRSGAVEGTLRSGMRIPIVRGRYDAAVTNDENRRHWAYADHLSANAAVSPEVRRVLRSRARYEVANNSYAKGIVLTLANDCVGTGPRLQLLTQDNGANRIVEREFMRWAGAVRLAEKLRTIRAARTETGEVFGMFVSNPRIDSPIKLDLRLIEADQIGSLPGVVKNPRGQNNTIPAVPPVVDGIVFDEYGNPIEYHLLPSHPGDMAGIVSGDGVGRIPASVMIHYFRIDRPGQFRGIPDITPALPLFAMLRRYTLAVIAAAETAADFAAVLYTDAPANGEADSVEPMDLVELERRMATVLPGGWKLGQVAAEQPATTYTEFKHEILNEIARCLNMPFNVAAGNSSGYNYASGRLDHQTYYKSIRVDQSQLGRVVLDPLLGAWLNEAVLVEGLLPQGMRERRDASAGPTLPSHQWFWDGQEHVDPLKEANAQSKRLESLTTTLAYEYARQGRDWEAELRQRAKEIALMKSLGLDPAMVQPMGKPQDAATDAPVEDSETIPPAEGD